MKAFEKELADHGAELNEQIELELKYTGYIERQKKEVAKLEHLENIKIPKHFDYDQVIGLRTEAKQKLNRFTPITLAQASHISGLSPADISILLIALKKKHYETSHSP